MERPTSGTTDFAAREGARPGLGAGEFGPAAERLTAAIGDLDRRYGWSRTVKDHPWPAIAVAAGIGFALAETGLDRGADSATSEAKSGLRTSAATLVDTLATAATSTVTQVLHGQLDTLVNELKQAIGAPTQPR